MVQEMTIKARSEIIIIYTVPSCTLEGTCKVYLVISHSTMHVINQFYRRQSTSSPSINIGVAVKYKQLFHCHTSKGCVYFSDRTKRTGPD